MFTTTFGGIDVITTFKYVRHEDIPAYVALGWRDTEALRDTHHDEHAALLEWRGVGEPVYPDSV